MARLPAPLAVLATLPLRRIPFLPLRLAALPRPDALLRVGVPESVLSCPSRRSSSAIRSSIRRRSSRSAASSARSITTSASFASTTARNRASSSRRSPAPAGRSGTSPDHAQPQLQVQASHTSCRDRGCQRARHHGPAGALTLAVGDAVAVRRVLASGKPAAPTGKHPRTFPERPERGPRQSAA